MSIQHRSGYKLTERTSKYRGSSEYRAWINIRQRCRNVNHPQYKDYGGRGIKICDEWDKSFIKFINDVGEKPTPKHSIDRIDNDGNYEPRNVKWSTRTEQANNKRDATHHKVKAKSGHRGIVIDRGGYNVFIKLNGDYKYIGRTKTILQGLKIQKDFLNSL